ncbi:nitroreductase [Nonlabens sp. YIK11]|uniref:nitroreductase family protein n=1 Tax=Nonlabens sp. YIK11 TaxID=1453349 RepID=UPI0006DBED4B|nr:nitroreductase [Nonlabens sp. YIK11]KQC33428.1 nitroreductase [Nonlabens sp. YIK11]
MKTLLETLQQRRSRFPAEYTGEPIAEEHLNEILEAARWAPNHKKTQPWKYKVVRGAGLQKLSVFMGEQFEKSTGKSGSMKTKKMAEKMQQSSTIILIFLHRDKKESIPEWEEVAAVSMSVQNMWLMTHQLGYGAYWSSPKSFANMNEFEAIETSPNDQFLGFFYMGTVANQPTDLPKRKSIEEFTEFID